MKLNFTGKTVIITGATSGIGKACARLFSQFGANISITGRNGEELKKLSDETDGSRSIYLEGDIKDENFRTDLIAKTVDKFGGIDVLINSAGIIASGTVENTKMEDFDDMMDINVRSVFALIQLSLPWLEKSRGNIVNVSSITGLRAFPGVFAYCISKAAVDQLTRVAALELAEKKVRVNAVNPGVVETNLHKRSGMDSSRYDQFKEHSKTTHPIGRIGQPEEVASLIAFLASDDADWITGGTYSIDGGRQLTCAR